MKETLGFFAALRMTVESNGYSATGLLRQFMYMKNPPYTDDKTTNDASINFSIEDMLDEMLEGLQVISPDWRYLYVNETVARQGKRAKKDLLGRTMMECYPGIDKTSLWESLERCMRKREHIHMKTKFVFPDKTEGWFDLAMHPVSSGMLILSLDITDLVKVEDALREKVEHIDLLMKTTIDREARMMTLKEEIAKLKMMMADKTSG